MADSSNTLQQSDEISAKVPIYKLKRVSEERQYVWLRRMILAIIVFNAADAVLTLHWIWNGLAIEANPVMAVLVYKHPLAFFLIKMTLILLGSAILWRNRTRPFSIVAIVGMFLVYYWLMSYHLQALSMWLQGYKIRWWD